MTTHKHINVICCVVLSFTLILTFFLMVLPQNLIAQSGRIMGYEEKLFDTSLVHTIDIQMDNWEEFLNNCKNEEYYNCTLVIDGETYSNVAIRGKGNTSLTQVDSYGNDRYSFKVEFDHYDNSITYHGLDKLALNNIIQDNTYMKDYLTYQMMNEMGVASPLCSYVYITVNGENWGLYLAIECVEESFLQRNYGSNYGDLYKPDSMNMGGGRGHGKEFNMEDFEWDGETPEFDGGMPGGKMPDFGGGMPGGEVPDFSGDMPGGEVPDFGSGFGGMGSDDVLLKYIDDDFDSYSNIFDSAKTQVTDSDKKRLIHSLKNLSAGEDLSDTVDMDAVIRYFVVHNFVVNFDSYTGSMIHNYYLYEEDGQLQMIPWDYNLAFGGFQASSDATALVNYPIDSPVSGGNTEDRPMIAWIFENEEYTDLYHWYFEEFMTNFFANDKFTQMLDDTKELISPYVEKDPTAFCTYEEFETGVATLRQFCLLRAESISGQLSGTIGSTTETQKNSALIDASDLSISAMGSMGFGDNNFGDRDFRGCDFDGQDFKGRDSGNR